VTELMQTPARMVEGGRLAAYGRYTTPFRENNLLDLDIFGRGGKSPRWMRALRLKNWQHYGIIHPDYYLGFVVLNAGYMSTSFCFVCDRTTRRVFEHQRKGAGGAAKVAAQTWQGETNFKARGYSIDIHNRLAAGRHEIAIRIEAKGALPSVTADLVMLEDLSKMQPLTLLSPITDHRPLYTHKAPAAVEGEIRVGGRSFTLDPARDVGLLDEHHTFFSFNTNWRWATFGGRDSQGRLIALNLNDGLVSDEEKHNENCLWVDGKLSGLGAAKFDFDPADVLAPWRIRTTDGKVDLEFSPEGERKEKVNLGLIMSDFHQPFGRFRGNVIGEDGAAHKVEDYFGVAEYHRARF